MFGAPKTMYSAPRDGPLGTRLKAARRPYRDADCVPGLQPNHLIIELDLCAATHEHVNLLLLKVLMREGDAEVGGKPEVA